MDFPRCLCACAPICACIMYSASSGEMSCMDMINPCQRKADRIEQETIIKDIEKRIDEYKHE